MGSKAFNKSISFFQASVFSSFWLFSKFTIFPFLYLPLVFFIGLTSNFALGEGASFNANGIFTEVANSSISCRHVFVPLKNHSPSKSTFFADFVDLKGGGLISPSLDEASLEKQKTPASSIRIPHFEKIGWIFQNRSFEENPFIRIDLIDKNTNPSLRMGLQWHCLKTIIDSPHLSSFLKNIAIEKLNHFQKPLDSDERFSLLKNIEEINGLEALKGLETLKDFKALEDLKALNAIEFGLHSFIDPYLDYEFRIQMMIALSQFSDPKILLKGLQILLPIVRGVNYVTPYELQLSGELIRSMALPLNKAFEVQEKERIKSIRPLDEEKHVNSVYLVEYESGEKAIFKPLTEEAKYGSGDSNLVLFTREVSSFPIIETWLENKKLRASGKSRIFVPKTIETIITHEGKSYGIGSLQFFVKDFMTLEQFIEKEPLLWEKLKYSPEWGQTEAIIRVFDFLLGNHDRFPNSYHNNGNFRNILIQVKPRNQKNTSSHENLTNKSDLNNGANNESNNKFNNFNDSNSSNDLEFKIYLIDNSLGRPGEARFNIQDAPLPEHIPNELKEILIHFDIDSFLKSFQGHMSERGLEDFQQRLFQLKERIGAGGL